MTDAKTIMLAALALVALAQAFYLLVLYGRLVRTRRSIDEVLARTESVLGTVRAAAIRGQLDPSNRERESAAFDPNYRRTLQ